MHVGCDKPCCAIRFIYAVTLTPLFFSSRKFCNLAALWIADCELFARQSCSIIASRSNGYYNRPERTILRVSPRNATDRRKSHLTLRTAAPHFRDIDASTDEARERESGR
ncbi:hypothetical protein PUN28_013004 [Cardiocondyla obscurior]|uniref:Secreted protein n=1 Tax=Cardiocondyla obscurior TaxID=286306 RepID=A0AAW2F9R8_9HYME